MKFFNNEEMKRQESITKANLLFHLAKADVLSSLKNYVKEREGFFSFTWLFRNKALTQEKIKLTKNTISFIETFEGMPEELSAALRSLRIDNAKLSARFNKFHCNLMSKKNPHYLDREVRRGELGSLSELADILHGAIEEIDRFKTITPPFEASFKVVNK